MADNDKKSKIPRVLLLFPNPISTIPTGFTFVGKRFKQNGFETKLYINSFRNFKSVDEIFHDVVKPFAPDIVGLSFATFNVLEVYRLFTLCKEEGYFVVSGGNHPSIRPEESVRYGADLVFKGESELSIDEFCRWFTTGRDLKKRGEIRGIGYIDEQSRFVQTPCHPRIKKLDDVGETDFSLLDLKDFTVADGSIKGLNIISCGRGCPFQCTFCSHRDWVAYSHRSADSIFSEMVKRNEKYGVKNFWLADETFTVDRAHVYEFCEKFKKAKVPFTWMIGTRVTAVDEKLLATMKASGLAQITYGVESADDETLKRTRKGYTAKQAYETVVMTGRLKIPMYINLMTGFPWETPSHVENDIKFIKAVEKDVNCFQLYGAAIPYPDTPLYEEYHEKSGFTDFWLKEKYQNAGMVIYQNVANPYTVSTYFQRNLYDDTYVAEDYFFKFTSEYKRAVARMGLLIGWKSIQAQTDSPLRRYQKYATGYLSRALYEIAPNLEKKIIGGFVTVNRLHETRATGKFIKK